MTPQKPIKPGARVRINGRFATLIGYLNDKASGSAFDFPAKGKMMNHTTPQWHAAWHSDADRRAVRQAWQRARADHKRFLADLERRRAMNERPAIDRLKAVLQRIVTR